jgi:hypothetical protein
MQWLEALSYIVTILGFPVAIAVFLYEQRKERANEADELHRTLSEEYDNFLKLVLQHADLLLLQRARASRELTDEQKERRYILLSMLVSLFEKAFIIVYDPRMTKEQRRRWLSWEDDMRDWCRREDFRAALPQLLEGEDDAFSAYITALAEAEGRKMQWQQG